VDSFLYVYIFDVKLCFVSFHIGFLLLTTFIFFELKKKKKIKKGEKRQVFPFHYMFLLIYFDAHTCSCMCRWSPSSSGKPLREL